MQVYASRQHNWPFLTKNRSDEGLPLNVEFIIYEFLWILDFTPLYPHEPDPYPVPPNALAYA